MYSASPGTALGATESKRTGFVVSVPETIPGMNVKVRIKHVGERFAIGEMI